MRDNGLCGIVFFKTHFIIPTHSDCRTSGSGQVDFIRNMLALI